MLRCLKRMSVVLPLSIKEMNVPAGKYYIKAFCDSVTTINESDKSNNIGVSRKFSVK